MAPKKNPSVPLKSSSGDASTVASGNEDSCGNNSGIRRKTKPSGTVVKSRYMQTEKKTVIKKNTPSDAPPVPARPASPRVDSGHKPRVGASAQRWFPAEQSSTELLGPAAASSNLESSSFGGNVFQSTMLDGHVPRPEFDVSVIEAPPPGTVDPNATFLLAFLTAKIEHNTHKFKEEAESKLVTLMEEEAKLRSQVMSKKRQHLHLGKQQQHDEALQQQIQALTPVAAVAKQFTEEYKTFSSAIDTTRHELPFKNFHIEGDQREFVDKAVVCLNESWCLLERYRKDVSTDSERTASCLKDIKRAACEIDQNVLSASSDLMKLSSLVSQEAVLVRQCLEEDKIGFMTAQSLYSK